MENACESVHFKHITTSQLCKNEKNMTNKHITKDSAGREVGAILMIIPFYDEAKWRMLP